MFLFIILVLLKEFQVKELLKIEFDDVCLQALDLAALATEHAQFRDWWWKVQLGKCYYR